MTPLRGRRGWLAGGLCGTLFFVAGCGHVSVASDAKHGEQSTWSGRFSLRIDGDPPQSWAAGFVLEGDADEGRLALNSPLGTRLASLDWRPGLARLDMRDGRSPREAASLGMLLTHLDSGVGPLDQLPLAALFAWLRGQDAQSGGWQADLSRRAEGRIRAERRAPLPALVLTLVLDEAGA